VIARRRIDSSPAFAVLLLARMKILQGRQGGADSFVQACAEAKENALPRQRSAGEQIATGGPDRPYFVPRHEETPATVNTARRELQTTHPEAHAWAPVPGHARPPLSREKIELGSPVIGRLIGALACIAAALLSTPAGALDSARLTAAVRAEEQVLQARVGMAVADANTGETWHYRGDERFPLNSTHKVFACAALLARVDERSLSLDQAVSIHHAMLVPYSPVTEQSLAPRTLSWGQLCQAAVSHSDNTAANAVIDAIGGPSGLTAFMRSIGDGETRLDRREPELNEAIPGDLRDSTTPSAIVASLAKVLLGDVLSASSRAELTQWMADDQVAGALLRAALPAGWKIADKTGAGGYGSRSIIAVIWPPSRRALVVAIYVTQTSAARPASDQAIARIGAALKEAAGQ
jgi:beta-lactamase class A